MKIDSEQHDRLIWLLQNPEEAMKVLPEEEQKAYRDAQQSIVDAAVWKDQRGRSANGNTSVLHTEIQGSIPCGSINQNVLRHQCIQPANDQKNHLPLDT